MGYDLNGFQGYFRFGSYAWSHVLKLAEMYDWKPKGTLPPNPEIKKLRINEVDFQKVTPLKEGTRIGKAINEMNTFNTYCMPIVGKDGKLKGLISISDIYDKFVSGFPIKRETRLRRL